MSYILDALKKSEAERTRGVAPSLLDGRPVAMGSRVGIWILLAALLVNAAIGAFWLFSSQTVVGGAPASAAMPAAAQVQSAAPTGPSATRSSTTMPSAAQLPSAPPQGEPVAAPFGSEMELADLSFSTHVYASDPSMRAVTLNGRRLVEGDTIAPGVRIEEITETGVVINVNGRTVPLEVLQDWR